MVTFITILQVNLVMSILLYVMVLAYLYGIQGTDMDSSRRGQQQQPSPDPLNSLIIQLLQADLTRGKIRDNQSQQEKSKDAKPDAQNPLVSFPMEEQIDAEQRGSDDAGDQQGMVLNLDLLRTHKRYNSPRVLLSDRPPLQPPPLYLTEDFVSSGADGASSGNKTRKKRYAEHRSYRGEYPVCDSESQWVTNKTRAVDIKGNSVIVVPKFKGVTKQDFNQYFYETQCRTAKPFKGGCRGIDVKNWNSQCKTVQTFVRALIQVRNTMTWEWIRINTSCVCALSKKRRKT